MKRKKMVSQKRTKSGSANLFMYLLLALILLSCAKDEAQELSSLNNLQNVTVINHQEVYVEINNLNKSVQLLVPFNSLLDLQKVKLRISISAGATSNIDTETEYDLRNSILLEITAEDGTIANYTVNTKKCEGGKSAVIVSDTQIDILPLFRQTGFFINSNIVLDKAYQADIPIYYVMLTSLKETERWDLPSRLHYYSNGKIVDKGDFVDAFHETILHKEFLEQGISKVYIIGVSSMGCVIGTCRGAAVRKYEVTLISNAHDEPIGYRQEASIDECNQVFSAEGLGRLIEADNLEF